MQLLRILGLLVLAIGLTSCGKRDSEKASSPPTAPSLVTAQTPGPSKASSAPIPIDPHFVNVTKEAGLKTVLYCGGPSKNHILEANGTGAAFVDYDNDGRQDIYLVNAWALEGGEPSRVRLKGHNALYHNLGDGRFEDVTDRAGVADDSWGCGVSVADFDNDGQVDLFVTNFGTCRLYRNRGNGTFEQVAERAGLTAKGWWSGSAFFDADGDGDLDLYVANYIDTTMDEVLAARRTIMWREKVKVLAGPFGLRGGRDRFYRNIGNGTFSDETDKAGMTDTAESYGLGVIASDFDNDGDIDVYVANDSNPNFLYRNDGKGTFTEVGVWAGAALSGEGASQAGMGVDAGDLDGDGLSEIFVTNFAQDSATIYQNLGNLLFADISAPQGLKVITHNPLKWGCSFLDFDLDGDLDLVIVNGHIYPQVDTDASLNEAYKQLPFVLRNDKRHFVDVSRKAGPGMQEPSSSRGLATGDYDNDGDLDLLVTAIDSLPLLLRNDTPRTGHWVKIQLVNRHGSPAIGARATIKVGGKSQFRELRSGTSFQSQNALELHFGLDQAEKINELEIRWPNGKTSLSHDLDVDITHTFREGPAPPAGEPRLR